MAKPSIPSKGIVTTIRQQANNNICFYRRPQISPVASQGSLQYVEVTAAWRATDQLFVCHGDHRKGTAVSKDRLSPWVREVIVHAYAGHELPASVKCHSVRAVATSWAALRVVQLSDICDAATWKTPSTFARFYRLNVVSMPPVCSVMLTNDS